MRRNPHSWLEYRDSTCQTIFGCGLKPRWEQRTRYTRQNVWLIFSRLQQSSATVHLSIRLKPIHSQSLDHSSPSINTGSLLFLVLRLLCPIYEVWSIYVLIFEFFSMSRRVSQRPTFYYGFLWFHCRSLCFQLSIFLAT